MSEDLVVYGSYGYTGSLITEALVDRGYEPLLAGRNRDALTDQAIRAGCDSEVVALDEPSVLDMVVEDAAAVLHCAGPFAETAAPMVEACLRTGTHYLDVTGEIDVFEAVHDRDADAEEAGVMLLPGTGFDVVPTDCLAAHLHERLPDATELELAFDADVGVSPGTAKTVVDQLGSGGRVRRDGRLVDVPSAHATRRVDFGWGKDDRHAAAIPWGDVSTAYHTTGIPNVTVYMSMPPSAVRWQRAADHLSPVLGLDTVKRLLRWLVDAAVTGPDEQERADEESYVWGEARTEEGERVVSRLRCPHTYATTVETAIAVASRVLDGDAPTGFQTPAGAYGPDLILDVDGVEREVVV